MKNLKQLKKNQVKKKAYFKLTIQLYVVFHCLYFDVRIVIFKVKAKKHVKMSTSTTCVCSESACRKCVSLIHYAWWLVVSALRLLSGYCSLEWSFSSPIFSLRLPDCCLRVIIRNTKDQQSLSDTANIKVANLFLPQMAGNMGELD